MSFKSKLLNGLFISSASLTLASCQITTGGEDTDTDTNITVDESDANFTQQGSVLTPDNAGDNSLSFAWEINDTLISTQSTLDLSRLNIEPIHSVTLLVSDGQSIVSNQIDVDFNNRPQASFEYDHITGLLKATSTDADGDTLTHDWIINGETFTDTETIDINAFDTELDIAISLTSSDSELSNSSNIYDFLYWDFIIEEKIYGHWLLSSGQLGLGNPLYKITNYEPGVLYIDPQIINVDEFESERVFLTLYDTNGSFVEETTNSNSLSVSIEAGDYYLEVGTYNENYIGEFELAIGVSPTAFNSQADFIIELDSAGIYDNSQDQYNQPNAEFFITDEVAESYYEDPDGYSLTYTWIIDGQVIGFNSTLDLSTLTFTGFQEIFLTVEVAGEKSSTFIFDYNFGYTGFDFEVANIEDSFNNSGQSHVTSNGNDVYELTVLAQSEFNIHDNNYSLCIYLEDIYFENETYDCVNEIETTLLAGTYDIIISSSVDYSIDDYSFDVLSSIENAATITLKEKGIDEGRSVGLGHVFDSEYYSNATVCFDINFNNICDEGESFTNSDSIGSFDLYSNTHHDLALNATMVQARGSNLILKPFQPYSYIAITPLTTLMYNYDLYRITNDTYYQGLDTHELTRSKLGLNYLSLDDDYIYNAAPQTDTFNKYKDQIVDEVSNIIYNDLVYYHGYFDDINSPVARTTFDQALAYEMMGSLDEVAKDVIAILSAAVLDDSKFDDISFDVNISGLIANLERSRVYTNAKLQIGSYANYSSYFEELKIDIILLKNVDFEFDQNDFDEHHNQLAQDFADESIEQDLVIIDSALITKFMHTQSDSGMETLLDLTSEFEQYKDNFPEFAVEYGKDYLGQQKAIPINLGPVVAFYRKEYMEDLRFDTDLVMHSWDQFISYGEYLKDNHNVYLIPDASTIAQIMIYGNTTENTGVYFTDNNENLVESDRFKEAFAIAKEIRDKGLDANAKVWSQRWIDGLRDGDFAMEIQGAWLLNHLESWIAPETSGSWSASTLPNDLNAFFSGGYASIPTSAQDNKEEAWRVIEFMLDEQYQLEAYEQWGMLPANINLYTDDSFYEPIEFLDDQPAKRIFAQSAENIKPVKHYQFDHQAESLIFEEALPAVLNGEKTIDEALSDVADQLDQLVLQ